MAGSVASSASSIANSVFSAAAETMQFFSNQGKQLIELLPESFQNVATNEIVRRAFEEPVTGPWANLMFQPVTVLYGVKGACEAQIKAAAKEMERLENLEKETRTKMNQKSEEARFLNEEYLEISERLGEAYNESHVLRQQLDQIEADKGVQSSKTKMAYIVMDVVNVLTGDEAMGGEPKPFANIRLEEIRRRLGLQDFKNVMSIKTKNKAGSVKIALKRLGLEDNPEFQAKWIDAPQDFYDRNGRRAAIMVGRDKVDLVTRIHLADCLGIDVPQAYIDHSWAIKRGEVDDALPPVMEIEVEETETAPAAAPDLTQLPEADLEAALAVIRARKNARAGANESDFGNSDEDNVGTD